MSVKHKCLETREKQVVRVKNDAIWLKLDCLNFNYLAITDLDFVDWLIRKQRKLANIVACDDWHIKGFLQRAVRLVKVMNEEPNLHRIELDVV